VVAAVEPAVAAVAEVEATEAVVRPGRLALLPLVRPLHLAPLHRQLLPRDAVLPHLLQRRKQPLRAEVHQPQMPHLPPVGVNVRSGPKVLWTMTFPTYS
jgi:hypothetical protein